MKQEINDMAHKHTRHHKKREFPTWDRDEKVRTYSLGNKRHLRTWRTMLEIEHAERVAQAGGAPVDLVSIVARHNVRSHTN